MMCGIATHIIYIYIHTATYKYYVCMWQYVCMYVCTYIVCMYVYMYVCSIRADAAVVAFEMKMANDKSRPN